MIFWMEAVVGCLLFTIVVVPSVIRNPLAWLSDYPPAIRARARELGLICAEQKKLPPAVLVRKSVAILTITVLLALALVFLNGARTFGEGFFLSYGLWLTVNWYDTFVIDWLWFCHSKKVMLPGTEDMTDAYHDYGFHFKIGIFGMGLGLPVCLLVGFAVVWLARMVSG